MNTALTVRSAAVAGAVGVASVLLAGGAIATVGSSSNKSQTLDLVGLRTYGATKGPVQFAGLVGDYGNGHYVDAAGKATQMGDFYKTVLTDGDVTLNVEKLNSQFQSNAPAFYDKTSCSGEFKISAIVPVTSGTGAYKGISGSLNVQGTSTFRVPRFTSGSKKGSCDFNAPPQHAITLLTGHGTATP